LLSLPLKNKRSLSLVETILLSVLFHAVFLFYIPSLSLKDTFEPMELDINILINEPEPIKEVFTKPESKPSPIKEIIKPEPTTPIIKPEKITQSKTKNNLTPTIESYSVTLTKAIAKQKKYPRIAQIRGWQGEIIIDLEIDGQGNLIKSKIKQRSKFKILDDEGMNMVKRASPFPKPPKELESKIFNVIVPISFKLQQ
jgi:periplasmic protein TonB